MSTKTKLISTISVFCMVLALLVTGVWAVSTANITLGGTVSFTADNVNAVITGSITGIQETDVNIKPLTYTAKTKPEQAELNSWNNNVSFDSGNLITMTITVQNKSTERSLYVKVTDNTTTTNIDKTFTADKAGVESGKEYELIKGGTITYTMTMKVASLDQSASATYAYNVDLRDANAQADEPDTFALEYDEENEYYYVNMGKYQGTDVRWRYISSDGETKYTSTTAPDMTTGQGWFVQETQTVSMAFDADSYEYDTSDVAIYLDTYKTVLGIADTDPVYSKIKPRAMTDLYKEIRWGADDDGNELIDGTTTSTAEVHFWLMSINEIYDLIGGGNGISYSSFGNYPDLAWTAEYMSRSHGTDGIAERGDHIYSVVSGPEWSTLELGGARAIRPAFMVDWTQTTAQAGVPIPNLENMLEFGDLDSDAQTATVIGNSITTDNVDLVIPEKVTLDGVEYTITKIGDEAFYDCSYLTSVTIPASVTTIGREAFWGCANLATATIHAVDDLPDYGGGDDDYPFPESVKIYSEVGYGSYSITHPWRDYGIYEI